MNSNTVTQDYVDRVKTAVKDNADFQEEGLPELLASSCWRHDWPLPKAYFEGDSVNFSDEDTAALDNFLETLDSYAEALNDDPQDTVYTDDDEEEDMTKLSEGVTRALGLNANATEQQAIEAIANMQASTFSEAERNALEVLSQEHLVSKYMEETEGLTVIGGTTRERAEKLAAMTEEAALDRLNEWKAFQESVDGAGVTETILRAYDENVANELVEGPSAERLVEFAEANKIEDPDKALAAFAIQDPKGFSAYRDEILSS